MTEIVQDVGMAERAAARAWAVYGPIAAREAAQARRRGEDMPPTTTSVYILNDPDYSSHTGVIARPKRRPKATRAVPYDEALARLLARRVA